MMNLELIKIIDIIRAFMYYFITPNVFLILGFLLTFFIFRWKKRQMVQNWRFWLVGFALSVLLYLIIVGGFFAYMGIITYTPSRSFDSDEWKADPERGVEFIDSLIKSKQLDGKTRKEVIELLGEEKEKHGSEDVLEYYIGDQSFNRGFIFPTPCWLQVYLSEDVVSGYKVICD